MFRLSTVSLSSPVCTCLVNVKIPYFLYFSQDHVSCTSFGMSKKLFNVPVSLKAWYLQCQFFWPHVVPHTKHSLSPL